MKKWEKSNDQPFRRAVSQPDGLRAHASYPATCPGRVLRQSPLASVNLQPPGLHGRFRLREKVEGRGRDRKTNIAEAREDGQLQTLIQLARNGFARQIAEQRVQALHSNREKKKAIARTQEKEKKGSKT